MTSIIGYDNHFVTGSVSASTEESGFEKENAYDWNTVDHWKPTAVPATLTIDMGSAVTADFFGLAGHDLFTNSASVRVRYSSDNFSVDINDAFSDITPTSNDTIFKSFTSQSARYWQIYLSGGISSIGLVCIGDRLELPIGMPRGYGLIYESRDVKRTNQISETGEFIGSSIISSLSSGSIRMRNLPAAWVRTNWQPLADHIIGKPFFWQWDNENYPNESNLCWLMDKVPTPTYQDELVLQATLQVQAR